MKYVLIASVALICFISTVNCQLPDIVDEIWPEVKRKGQTGRLTCTVINKFQNSHKVIWSQNVAGQSAIVITSDTEIKIQNNIIMGLGKFKYDVKKAVNGARETYTLIINNLGDKDSGTYTCYIQMQSVAETEWPRKKGIITVLVAPEVQQAGTTSVVELGEGDVYNMTCFATGMPFPNITWARADGGWLPNGAAKQRGNIMPMGKVEKEQRGVYRCIADNNVPPPAEHFAELRVFFKPEAFAIQDTVGQAQNRQYDTVLECVVSGYPEPTVYWQRKETDKDNSWLRLGDDDKFDINKQTSNMLRAFESWYSLKIKNVQANDYTEYECVATNRYGSNQTSFFIFETMECQGPNCPSFKVGSSAISLMQTSLFLLMSVILSMMYR